MEHLFEGGFAIYGLGVVADDWGNETEAWVTKTEDAYGRLRPLSGDRRLVDGRTSKTIDAKIYFSGDTNVSQGDEIRHKGKKWEVLFAPDIMDFGTMLAVEVSLK